MNYLRHQLRVLIQDSQKTLECTQVLWRDANSNGSNHDGPPYHTGSVGLGN